MIVILKKNLLMENFIFKGDFRAYHRVPRGLPRDFHVALGQRLIDYLKFRLWKTPTQVERIRVSQARPNPNSHRSPLKEFACNSERLDVLT